jgi:hypothetical protein
MDGDLIRTLGLIVLVLMVVLPVLAACLLLYVKALYTLLVWFGVHK